MKVKKAMFAASTIAGGLVAAAPASAASINVQFQGNANGIPVTTGTGTAGAFPVANSLWNVEGTTTNQSSAVTVNATDGTTGQLTWSSSNLYGSGGGSTPAGELLTGYLDNNGGTPSTATLTLPASIAGTGSTPYNVYVYIAGDNTGRGGTSTVNGTSVTVTELANDGSGNYVEAVPGTYNSTTNIATGIPGNYYEFTGITGTTLTITNLGVYGSSASDGVTGSTSTDMTPRVPFNGFQVVSAPEPASLGLLGLAGFGLLARRRKA